MPRCACLLRPTGGATPIPPPPPPPPPPRAVPRSSLVAAAGRLAAPRARLLMGVHAIDSSSARRERHLPRGQRPEYTQQQHSRHVQRLCARRRAGRRPKYVQLCSRPLPRRSPKPGIHAATLAADGSRGSTALEGLLRFGSHLLWLVCLISPPPLPPSPHTYHTPHPRYHLLAFQLHTTATVDTTVAVADVAPIVAPTALSPPSSPPPPNPSPCPMPCPPGRQLLNRDKGSSRNPFCHLAMRETLVPLIPAVAGYRTRHHTVM